MKGQNSSAWEKSLSNEWGRLAQGNNGGVKDTDTIQFITLSEVLKNKKLLMHHVHATADHLRMNLTECKSQLVVIN